jgi:hypothetical protein
LTSQRAVYIETSTLELDSIVALYSDAQGQNLIARDDDSGVGYAGKISGRVLGAGTYYVKISLGTQTQNTSGSLDLRIYTGLPQTMNLIDWSGLANVSDELFGFFQSGGGGLTKLVMAQMTSDQALFNEATTELTSSRRRLAVLLRDPSFDLAAKGSVSVGVSADAGGGVSAGVQLGAEGSANFVPGIITGTNKKLAIYVAFTGSGGFGSIYATKKAKLGLVFVDAGVAQLRDWYSPEEEPDFWGSLLRGTVNSVSALQSINLIRMADAAAIEGSSTLGVHGGVMAPYGNGLEVKVGAGVAGDMEIYIQQIWNGVQGIAQALANSIQNNSDSMDLAMNDLLSSRLYAVYGKAYAEGEVVAGVGIPIPACPILAAGVKFSAGAQLAFSTKLATGQGPLMTALNSTLADWLNQ